MEKRIEGQSYHTSIPSLTMNLKNSFEPYGLPGRYVGTASLPAFAFFVATLLAVPAEAQQNAAVDPASQAPADEPVVLEQYVVTSLRASLVTAQELKANSVALIDAIVAQDVGKFPDNTVAEALQRVPGIQVGRANGEVSSVVIRGLPDIATTINGYEVFTGTGRGVALQDIPADMIGALEVHKSTNPALFEGGIAGLIDIRLRRPFDFKLGTSAATTLKAGYANQADEYSYNGSFLVNNRWKTDAGEFGALVNISYIRRQYQDQVIDNYVHFPEDFDYTRRDAAANPGLTTHGYYADNFGWQIIPGDRKRGGASLSLQWKTNGGVELYSDTFFTNYEERRDVNFFIGIPSWGGFRTNVELYPAGAGGYVVRDPVAGRDNPPVVQDARFVKSFIAHDTVTLSSTQAFDNSTDTLQGAFGGKMTAGRVALHGEVSYSVSTVKTKGIILDTGITSPTQQLAISYNDNDSATVQASGVDYSDVNNYFMTQFYDQWSRAHSDFIAAKLDAKVELDSPVMKSLEFGGRVTHRKVNFRADSPGGTFIWDAARANSVPGLGMVTDTDPFVSADRFSIRQFWTPNSDWMLEETNTNQLRSIFGKPAGRPAPELGSAFNDTEKSAALYGTLNFHFAVGDRPVDGFVGVRAVNSDQKLSGFQRAIITAPDGSTSQAPYYEETHNDKTRWDVLPMLSARMKLTDKLYLRAAATKTIRRPNFDSLNPALSVTAATMTVPGSGSGGNPDLDPIESVNFDLDLNYLLTDASSVTLTGFYREIDGYIQSYSSSETIGGRSYNVTRPRNTQNGYLQGCEASWTQFLDFLPGTWKGFGVQANFTYIEGKSENPLTRQKQNLAQVAKKNYNVVLIYETGAVSARLAYNWRGKYIDSFNQPGLQPNTVWVQPRGQLDFSASYELRPGLLLTLDVTNLTQSKYRDNFGDLGMFFRDVRNYDRTIELGMRYRF